MWYRCFMRRNFSTASVTLQYARQTPTVRRRDARCTQMRQGRSDRLFLSSTVCATKKWNENAGVTFGQVCMRHPLAPALRCKTSAFSQTNYVSNDYKSNKKNLFHLHFFCRGKVYQSWMTGKRRSLLVKLYIFASQWPVTGTNFEACCVQTNMNHTCAPLVWIIQ